MRGEGTQHQPLGGLSNWQLTGSSAQTVRVQIPSRLPRHAPCRPGAPGETGDVADGTTPKRRVDSLAGHAALAGEAHKAERTLGTGEVGGSIPPVGSKKERGPGSPPAEAPAGTTRWRRKHTQPALFRASPSDLRRP